MFFTPCKSRVQGDGLRYEIGEFVSKINGLGGADFKLTAQESITMAEIVETFMKTRQEQACE